MHDIWELSMSSLSGQSNMPVATLLNETSSFSVCVSEPFSYTLFSSLLAQMDLIL